MRTRTAWGASAVLAVLVIACPRVAHAQDDAAADTAAARSLGVQGVSLADAGNCADAVDSLARSEKLHHAVSVLGRLGECQVQLGKLVEGTENLRRVVREPLAPDAPAPFVAAQERARGVLAAAMPRIARLKVAVAAPAGATVWVTIDGAKEPSANLNTDRPVDPGDHVVEAGAQGYLTASKKIHLAESGVDSVALTLEPDPNAPKVVPLPATSPAPAPAPPTTSGTHHTAGLIAAGIGLVGVGFGVAFGLAALNEKSNLDSACTNRACPSSQQGNLDSGNRFGTISTVGFIVGGVGLAAGAVLYFVDFGSSPSAPPDQASPPPAGVQARFYLGPASAGIAGTF